MEDPKPNGEPTEFESEKAKLDSAVEELKCVNRRRIDNAESIARMARGSRPNMAAVRPATAKSAGTQPVAAKSDSPDAHSDERTKDDLTGQFRALRSAS